MTPYPPELLRHQIIAISSSLLMSFVGLVALVYGLRSHDSSSKIFIAFAVITLLVGLPMAWLSFFWYRRAARLVSGGQEVSGSIRLIAKSDFDSTTLYAEVITSTSKSLRVAVLAPRWAYKEWLGNSQSAGLFVEPASSKIMAISTSQGMLWCIPHNVSV
jgi:hypothetical protein